MVNYSEFLVNYSNIWFNMGPSACNWIIGTQESHEKALQIGWEGFHRALELICSVKIWKPYTGPAAELQTWSIL